VKCSRYTYTMLVLSDGRRSIIYRILLIGVSVGLTSSHGSQHLFIAYLVS